MAQHVHDETGTGEDHLYRWDATRMARHLKDVHSFIAPMSWDLGRMHLHHLEDHQGPGPITPQPEETPVTETTEQTEAEQLEDQARHLWMESTDSRVPSNWDDLQQETRDYWRTQVTLRAEKKQASAVSTGSEQFQKLREADPAWSAAQAADERAHEDRKITVDRLIAAMTGVDFNHDWVADDSLALRGVLRRQLGHEAETLLAWLERGGALHLPVVAGLADDHDRLVVERDTAQKLQHAAERDRDLMREQAESLAEQLAEARRELEREKAHAAGMALQARQLVEDRAEAIEARGQLRLERDQLATQVGVQAELLNDSAERAEQHAAATLRGVAYEFRTTGVLLYTRDAVANALDKLAAKSEVHE